MIVLMDHPMLVVAAVIALAAAVIFIACVVPLGPATDEEPEPALLTEYTVEFEGDRWTEYRYDNGHTFWKSEYGLFSMTDPRKTNR